MRPNPARGDFLGAPVTAHPASPEASFRPVSSQWRSHAVSTLVSPTSCVSSLSSFPLCDQSEHKIGSCQTPQESVTQGRLLSVVHEDSPDLAPIPLHLDVTLPPLLPLCSSLEERPCCFPPTRPLHMSASGLECPPPTSRFTQSSSPQLLGRLLWDAILKVPRWPSGPFYSAYPACDSLQTSVHCTYYHQRFLLHL